MIALTLRGGTRSFDNVLKMIDEMVSLLGKEQTTDDEKKAYCEKELDIAEDEAKVLQNNIGDLNKAMDDAKETIATLTDEIADLVKSIKKLDSSVKDATEKRQEENAFYKKTMQEDTAAKEILKMAKNRLAQFYAPKMYRPPAKAERSTASRISESMSVSLVEKANPGPPPETWGAYKKKGEQHGGVIAMMDLLMADLDKEITEM